MTGIRLGLFENIPPDEVQAKQLRTNYLGIYTSVLVMQFNNRSAMYSRERKIVSHSNLVTFNFFQTL